LTISRAKAAPGQVDDGLHGVGQQADRAGEPPGERLQDDGEGRHDDGPAQQHLGLQALRGKGKGHAPDCAAALHARILRMRMLSRYRAPFALWLALTAAGCVLLARAELAHLREAFETDARIAHRLLSQRVVQHDAILATLALLQPAGRAGAASAEQRLPALYPQILSVQRRDADQAWPDAALAAAEARSRSARRPALADADFAAGRYRVVLAAEPASFAAQFDLRQLVPWGEWPMPRDTSPVSLALEHEGQRFPLQPGHGSGPWTFEFRKHLAAESQPFEVVGRRSVAGPNCPGAGCCPGPRRWRWRLPAGRRCGGSAPNASAPRSCCAWARSRG
jgi:hypothetical protein